MPYTADCLDLSLPVLSATSTLICLRPLSAQCRFTLLVTMLLLAGCKPCIRALHSYTLEVVGFFVWSLYCAATCKSSLLSGNVTQVTPCLLVTYSPHINSAASRGESCGPHSVGGGSLGRT